MNNSGSKQSSLTYSVKEMKPFKPNWFLEINLKPVTVHPVTKQLLKQDELGGVHKTHAFKEGFVVDGDQVDLEPIAPYTSAANQNKPMVTRQNAGQPKLVYSLMKDPTDKTAPLSQKIAYVKEQDPGTFTTQTGYSYKLFTYRDASSQSDLPYVFSGSDDLKTPGGYLQSNTFIPLDILHTRLCGDEKSRAEAYARDWLTYCRYGPGSYGTNLAAYDGSYLLARNSAGQLSPEQGVNFLCNLFWGLKQEPEEDLPRHIFARWCLLASAAASVLKEPFSVKARFWKIPKTLDAGVEIELIYEMLPDWWDKPENEGMMRSNGVSSAVKDTLGGGQRFKFDPQTQRAVFTEWEGFMGGIFRSAQASIKAGLKKLHQDEALVPTFRLLDPMEQRNDLVQIGSHPQGFYRTYIKENVKNQIALLGYRLETVRAYPNETQRNDIMTATGQQNPIHTGALLRPPTSITLGHIQTASNWPRAPTQNAVMGNISANQVANTIWRNASEKRCAEWLHRAAYSYGGNGSPDSSQDKGNLVFGTVEANTEMIRYEDYLKRMVERVSESQPLFSIDLTTSPNRRKQKTGDIGTLPWLVPELGYEWSFDVNQAFGRDILVNVTPDSRKINRRVDFNLFSRKPPMRYEVEVDEKFDMNLPNASAVLQAVLALFLISQSNFFAQEIKPKQPSLKRANPYVNSKL